MSEYFLRHWLLIVGFTGQIIFGTRFLVQWICSEVRKESHIPVAFWYISIVGSILLFIYSVAKKDPVFILGQSMGIIVYTRNLVLIYRKKGTETI